MTIKRPRQASISRIFLTPGEPAGIGPDLAVQAAQRRWPVEIVAVADPELLTARAQRLHLPLTLIPYTPSAAPRAHRPGRLPVYPVPLAMKSRPGKLNPANAAYVLNTLRLATRACQDGHGQALVTGPVHKGVIADAGFDFSGHTEYLAALTGAPAPVMLLVAGTLRVALATTHLPLREVPAGITRNGLRATLRVLVSGLQQRFGVRRPRILVAGLNPHAGEQGHLGREEIEVIEPVLNELRAKGMRLMGPLPADTLFTPPYLGRADAVLAMYHDQGLPVLKNRGFGRAVNITLGLPILRTSVDHGTALELAGTGKADPGSLIAAIEMAIDLCK